MLDAIKNRRSCRKFKDTPIEQEKIEEIINAGLLAPSGMNRQTPIIIAIKDKKTRDALMEINRDIIGWDRDPFYGAPVVLMVIANKNGLPVHDGTCVMENMLLEATNQGLGCCWIHRADEELVREDTRKLLSFTGLNFDDYVGIGHVIIGYEDNMTYPNKVIREGRCFIK